MVTVIIINWNGAGFLCSCIESLTRQTVRPEEILIVDNASSDHSIQSISHFQGINILRLTENVGFAAGNNRGLEVCSSEYVALLNPDAVPATDWLERLLEAARLRPDVAAFGSRQMIAAKEGVIDGLGDVYHCSGLVWRKGYGRRLVDGNLVSPEIFSPCAAAALYRREALVDAGGFDEDFFCYVEDVDLGFRLRLLGHKCLLVPDAVVHHVGSAIAGGRHSDFAVYHGHRNLVWSYVKNMPSILFWMLLPLHVVMNLLALGIFSLRGQARTIFLAKRDAVRGLRHMWRKRKGIQARRTASTGEIWRSLGRGG